MTRPPLLFAITDYYYKARKDEAMDFITFRYGVKPEEQDFKQFHKIMLDFDSNPDTQMLIASIRPTTSIGRQFSRHLHETLTDIKFAGEDTWVIDRC